MRAVISVVEDMTSGASYTEMKETDITTTVVDNPFELSSQVTTTVVNDPLELSTKLMLYHTEI